MDLRERRKEVIADLKGMEKHNPLLQPMFAAEGLHSIRPIAFLQDDEVVIVDECVGKVLDGLKKFVADNAGIFEDPEKANERWNYERYAYSKAKKILAQYPNDQELTPLENSRREMRVHQQTWNGIVHALSEAGIKVTMA